jgi:hypothetical protein
MGDDHAHGVAPPGNGPVHIDAVADNSWLARLRSDDRREVPADMLKLSPGCGAPVGDQSAGLFALLLPPPRHHHYLPISTPACALVTLQVRKRDMYLERRYRRPGAGNGFKRGLTRSAARPHRRSISVFRPCCVQAPLRATRDCFSQSLTCRSAGVLAILRRSEWAWPSLAMIRAATDWHFGPA